jgi:hypothetical protein
MVGKMIYPLIIAVGERVQLAAGQVTIVMDLAWLGQCEQRSWKTGHLIGGKVANPGGSQPGDIRTL